MWRGFITATILFSSQVPKSFRGLSSLQRSCRHYQFQVQSQCLHCGRTHAPSPNSVYLHFISRATMISPEEEGNNKPPHTPTPSPPPNHWIWGKFGRLETIVFCECLIKKTQWLQDEGQEVRFPKWRILDDRPGVLEPGSSWLTGRQPGWGHQR